MDIAKRIIELREEAGENRKEFSVHTGIPVRTLEDWEADGAPHRNTDIFAENAWYFRNSLVRANYNDLKNGIHETTNILKYSYAISC